MSNQLRAQSAAAAAIRRLACFSFVSTLVLLPVRWRIELLARPALPVQRDFTDFLLFAPDIAMLATLAFWGLSLAADRRRPARAPVHLWLPLALLSLAGWVSVLTSVDPQLSTYHAIRLLALFGFALYVVDEVMWPAAVVAGVALQGIIQSAVAIGQFLTQRSIGLAAFGEQPLDPAWKGVSVVSTGSERILRAYGLSDHPNILGGCLAFGLILLLAAYVWGGARTRLALGAAFLPMSLGLFYTFSRSAWLAFAASAAMLVGIQIALRRRGALLALSGLALVTGITLAPFVAKQSALLGVRAGLSEGGAPVPAEEQSVGERILLIEDASRLLGRHPVTGIGLGASPIAMQDAYPDLHLAYQPPHWTLMDAALETGILGSVAYLALLLLPWLRVMREPSLLARPAVAAAYGLLLAVTVVGLFDYYTWLLVAGRLWQWLAWGLAAASLRVPAEQGEMNWRFALCPSF